MSKILIVYDTVDGQCEKIARSMAELIQCLGHEATVKSVESQVTVLLRPKRPTPHTFLCSSARSPAKFMRHGLCQ